MTEVISDDTTKTIKNNELKKYAEYFQETFDNFENLSKYKNIDKDLLEVINNHRPWISKLSSPDFPVAFLGSFSAGKSFVVNALIGKKILPSHIDPLTAVKTLVKKSSNNKDYVEVHYLNKIQRIELRDLYIEEISKELSLNLDKNLDNNVLINNIKDDITRKKDLKKGCQIAEDLLKDLEKILSKIDDSIEKLKKIELKEIPIYVSQQNPDILFIDRVEVFLKDIELDNDIILIDLPGLGVVNPRHKKTTNDFIKSDAKALVLVLRPMGLFQDPQQKSLLENINSSSDLLSRSFLLVNQWDICSKEQEEQINKSIKEYSKSKDDKTFRISALYYLLLENVLNGDLDQIDHNTLNKITQEDFNNLTESKVKEIINTHQSPLEVKYIKQFEEFKSSLFSYLANDVRDEFKKDAERNLLNLIDNILNHFKLDYKSVKDVNRDSIIREKISEEKSKYIECLNGNENDSKKNFHILLNNIEKENRTKNFLDVQKIKAEIEKSLKSLNEEHIKAILTAGPGNPNQSVNLRLINIIDEQVNIFKIISNNYLDVSETGFFNNLNQKIKSEFRNINSSYVNKELNDFINDRVDSRNIKMRLKGILDVISLNYKSSINKALGSMNLQDSNNTQDSSKWGNPINILSKRENEIDLSSCIDSFKESIFKYIDDDVAININEYTKALINNYINDIKEELNEELGKHPLIVSLEDKIRIEVEKTINSELESEILRKSSIKSSYENILKIAKEIDPNYTFID